MPIKFITTNETFSQRIQEYEGYELDKNVFVMKIEDYVPDPSSSCKRTYYVSPANSLCFMDGGIDKALSQVVFPGIQTKVKKMVEVEIGYKNRLGRSYLPIGSSVVVDVDPTRSLIVSPTMLLPQNVSKTNNAYYATMAVLYHILVVRRERLSDVDILLTSFCCGYGKMDEDISVKQMLQGIYNYVNYKPRILNQNIVFHEPNLKDQPKYYQNTEWFNVPPAELIRC